MASLTVSPSTKSFYLPGRGTDCGASGKTWLSFLKCLFSFSVLLDAAQDCGLRGKGISCQSITFSYNAPAPSVMAI